MNNQNGNGSASPVARMIPVVIFFVGLLGIYYLYQYLFGPKTSNQYVLLNEQKTANMPGDTPITIPYDKLPPLYEGGEFSVSTWFYVSNWNHRPNKLKSIFRLGGTSFDTIRIFLGGVKPKLHVRFHNTTPSGKLETVNVTTLFESTQTESGLLDSPSACDLPEIDLQRWVNLVVTVNGRTCDIYLDGKLVRSCVLPSLYMVDTGYSAYLASHGGFGGYIASTMMYDAALNPDVVYRNYIAGPEPITSVGDWIRSIFKVGVNVSIDSK